MRKIKISSILLIITIFITSFIIPLIRKDNVSEAADVTANRTIDSAWVFILDRDGNLTIRLRDGQTTGGLTKDYTSKEDWNAVWKVAWNNNTDIRPYVKKVIFKKNNVGEKFDFRGYKADSMFEGFENVTEFSFEGLDASNAVSLKNFFKGCKALEKLDVSDFGNMSKIINMDGFIEGCSSLEELVLDNLDNSNIGPTNNRHSITPGQTGYVEQSVARQIGAKEYGREIFGTKVYDIQAAFPNLTRISVKDAKVWFCKNTKGLPGSEYYIAASDSDIIYLNKKKVIDFTPDGKETVSIDSKRDWVDIITDRKDSNKHTVNGGDALPDASTNINNKYNLNTNGAGFFAPGEYKITSKSLTEEKLKVSNTYYRIAYIGEVPFEITGVGDDDPDLILKKTENYAWLNTTTKTDWPTTGNYVIDRTNNPIKIVYKNAAVDIYGKSHNVTITINKITFKDLQKIPTHTGNERGHDGNRYIDYHPTSASNQNNQSQWTTRNTGYYRTILQASRNDGLTFRNYVKVGNGNTTPGSSADWQVLSGGSGTDIDFKIEVDGASGDQTFLFHADDLDVASSQNWQYPVPNDACYDNLPIAKAVYGLGGESFVLGDGNKLNTVTFASHTGLEVANGNTVISTGSDPDTPWSEFMVVGKANGSNYTWQTGIACTTYALRNTEPATNKLKITKTWKDNETIRPNDLKITVSGYNGTLPSWKKNGNVWTMTFIDSEHTTDPGYLVTETVPDYYDAITSSSKLKFNNDTGYFEASLDNKEQTVEIEVVKVWVDTEEQRSKRPSSIKLLIKNGDEIVDSYDLDVATETSHIFTDLPKYDANKNEISYTVDEAEVNEGDLKYYEKSISGTTITNTYNGPKEEEEEDEEEEMKEQETPKTGDNIMFWVGTMIISLCGILFTNKYLRKKD